MNQSPDITYEVAENVAQEITTRTINFSVEYQEEIQQACEAASNMG